MDNQEIRDCIIDELKSRLVYENGTWCYERSDYSGRDFYENIPLRYVNDDEYGFLEEDVYEWSDCSDLDWDDFDEIYEEVFWELANGEIKESIQTNSLKITLNEDFEEDIQEIGQEFTSANTSINSTKLPAVFNMVKFEPNTVNLDYGGGKFDNVADYLSKQDVINLVYDPYNRSKEHNQEVIRLLKEHGGADTCTCSNVLNVIKEPEVRLNVLNNIKKLLKPDGTVYITVYEGSGKGNEGETKSGYQLNRKTADYIEEIQQVFPDATRKGKLIVATNS